MNVKKPQIKAGNLPRPAATKALTEGLFGEESVKLLTPEGPTTYAVGVNDVSSLYCDWVEGCPIVLVNSTGGYVRYVGIPFIHYKRGI